MMNKKTRWVIIFTLSTLIQCVYAIDKNQVCFTNATINDFIPTGSSITDKQTMGNIYVDSKSSNCLIIEASHKNDAKNAAWVQQNMESDHIPWNEEHMVVTYASTIGSHTPSKLNFAVKGNLLITVNNVGYTCNEVQLGQGHYLSGNNWWIFNNHNGLEQYERWSLHCYITGSKQGVLLYPGTGYKNNAFTINFDIPEKNPGMIYGGSGV